MRRNTLTGHVFMHYDLIWDRPKVANLLDRDFSADQPSRKWGGDIIYVWLCEGSLKRAPQAARNGAGPFHVTQKEKLSLKFLEIN